MTPKPKKAEQSMTFEELQRSLRAVEAARQKDPHSSLSEDLAAAGLRNVLVVLSPESFRLERLVTFVHDRLFQSASQSIITTHAAELNQSNGLSAFIGDLVTPSLFAQSQLLVLWNGEKLKAATERSLAEALRKPLGNQLIVVAVVHSPKNAAPLQVLSEAGTVVSLPELQGEHLRRWIAKEIERFGVAKGIDSSVIDVLCRSFEGNLAGLLSEAQRLSLVAGKDRMIESRHLQGAALPAVEQSGNDLIRAILRKDRRQALLLAASLVENGMHPLQICAQLSKAYRALLAEKGSSGQRHKDVNAPWLTKQIGGRGVGEDELGRGIEILKGLDYALKDSGLEADDTLILAIEKLCRPEAAPAKADGRTVGAAG